MPANNTDESATQTLTVQSQSFTIPVPYMAGACTLTEGEANALNQTYAENIRNNFAQQMKRAAEEETPRQLTQADLDEYVDSYEFGKRPGGARGPRDPIGTEERKLASVALVAHVENKLGKKWKDLAKEKQDELLAKVIASGKFRAQAEEIVKKRQESAADLGDVDLAA
jgi:hypothetical protein